MSEGLKVCCLGFLKFLTGPSFSQWLSIKRFGHRYHVLKYTEATPHLSRNFYSNFYIGWEKSAKFCLNFYHTRLRDAVVSKQSNISEIQN